MREVAGMLCYGMETLLFERPVSVCKVKNNCRWVLADLFMPHRKHENFTDRKVNYFSHIMRNCIKSNQSL